ncbi:MAG: GNAT family N-acetyltransferase [Nocardioidaceae bacterium]|nr:GNAT family N-acetyltransferase [Nocardioidaceae bacterium]NUS50241.1 GNAT family N-acetyltransferase [Nocardioidaceae bacterium]
MTTSLVRTRLAVPDDVGTVHALVERCSPATLHARFHVPTDRLPARVVERLVLPRRGWSLVAEQCGTVVGHGCVGEVSRRSLEVGLLVEDAQHGRGIGSRLMRDLAAGAAARGYRSLVCVAQPDNEGVVPTINKAGLDALCTWVDGLLEIEVPLPVADPRLRHPA